MKALKILGGILLVLAVIAFILNMIAPKDYQVERSVTINAPAEKTFSYIQYFEKMSLWSPWESQDPKIKSSIKGTDGTVGAIHSWESEIVGTGSQEILAIDPLKEVKTQLRFVKPWEGESGAYLKMAPDGENQKVTWGFTGDMSFPMNVVMFFQGGMDKGLGPEYEKGLAKLKELVEADKSTATTNYEIKTIDFPASYYLGHREKIDASTITAYYTKHFPAAMQAALKNKGELAGMPSGLYYEWDEKNGKADLAAAIPLKKKLAVKGFESYEIPASKALQIDFYGEYDDVGPAHEAMEAYAAKNNLKIKLPCIEEYVTDPTTVKNPSEVLTKITYLIE